MILEKCNAGSSMPDGRARAGTSILVVARNGWPWAAATPSPIRTPREKASVPAIADRIYGTVSAARQKEMSGLEFVQGLANRTLPLNTIARTLGYDVTEAANGRVVIAAEPNDTLLNPAGTVHGGFSATDRKSVV